MTLAAEWRTGWAGRFERIAAGRHGLAVTAGLLGVGAVVEALGRAETVLTAFNAVRDGGRVVVVGLAPAAAAA